MPNAFISYRRKPSSSLAHLLQKDLQSQYGFDIYLDVKRSDGAKVQFPERLLGAIDASDVFICLLADTTLDSEWVLREIQRAFDGKKPCIPVFQESYQPTALDNPAVDYLLSFDGVQVMDERGLFMDTSVQQIGTIIRNTLPNRHRTALFILPLVLLLVGLIAIILLFTDRSDYNRQSATAFSLTQAARETAFRHNQASQETEIRDSQDTATAFSLMQATQETAFRHNQASQETEIRDSQDTATAFSLMQATQETADEISMRIRATQTTWTPSPTKTLISATTPAPSPEATSTPEQQGATAEMGETPTATVPTEITISEATPIPNLQLEISEEKTPLRKEPSQRLLADYFANQGETYPVLGITDGIKTDQNRWYLIQYNDEEWCWVADFNSDILQLRSDGSGNYDPVPNNEIESLIPLIIIDPASTEWVCEK